MAYCKAFEIRWSDLDVNRHVSNTAYCNLMIAVRMAYLRESGFDQQAFANKNVGPAIISEEFHYLRESPPDGVLRVDVELAGLSEDGRFVRFHHHIFHPDGGMAVFSRCTFCWIDLETRKICRPPEDLYHAIAALDRSEDFRVLSKADAFPQGLPKRRMVPKENNTWLNTTYL
jgi:acyl-CoA thioester hydrolase